MESLSKSFMVKMMKMLDLRQQSFRPAELGLERVPAATIIATPLPRYEALAQLITMLVSEDPTVRPSNPWDFLFSLGQQTAWAQRNNFGGLHGLNTDRHSCFRGHFQHSSLTLLITLGCVLAL